MLGRHRVEFLWRGWSQGSSGQPCSFSSLFSEQRQGEVTLREVFALLHGVGLSVAGRSGLGWIYADSRSEPGFPDSSVGKESACNAGDCGSIPGLGRSLGEGIGYPLQYSWASLVAQLVKNLPAVQKTWVQSLGWEDPREKGKATHSSILA